jgi:prepilin-type processing-associated H-X9-DG protein
METKGEQIRGLCDFLADSFDAREFARVLHFKGYGEVTSAVNQHVASAEYFFSVVEALDHRGLIDTAFFDHLMGERPEKETRIRELRKSWPGSVTTDASNPTVPPNKFFSTYIQGNTTIELEGKDPADWPPEKLKELMTSLTRIIGVHHIVVLSVRLGSVIAEIELTSEDYERLAAAFQSRKLMELGIINVGQFLELSRSKVSARAARADTATTSTEPSTTTPEGPGVILPWPANEAPEAPSRVGFRPTILETMVTVGIAATLVAMVLPAVHVAREAARRAQCVNNLKQIALAASNYESGNGTFPIGRNFITCCGFGATVENGCDGWSPLARVLSWAEQPLVYNSINWSDTPYGSRNSTAVGMGNSLYWCPSDATINGLRIYLLAGGWDGTTVAITYTNYAGMLGTYCPSNGRYPTAAELALENGMYPDVGTPLWVKSGISGATRPPVTYASITDGTSNTIAFAEIAHGRYENVGGSSAGGSDFECQGWWADADYGSQTITSYYPPNMPIPKTYYTTARWRNPDGCDAGLNIPVITSMSFHPGGVNCGFADGSVHFIKSSISSWNSMSITRASGASPNCTIPTGTQQGVWQSLSTINGGEVISSDPY